MEATLQVLTELETTGIISRYAIGGAVGAIFYIEPFLTYDLDIFVVLPQMPSGLLTLEPIYNELKRRGYPTEAECILIEGVPVQFLPTYNPLLEEALIKDRQRFSMFIEQASMDTDYLQKVLIRHQLSERFTKWKIES
jgi:hypothetical protein